MSTINDQLQDYILSVWENNPHRDAIKILAAEYKKSPVEFMIETGNNNLVSALVIMADEESLSMINPKKTNWYQDWIGIDINVANVIFWDEVVPALKNHPKELTKFITLYCTNVIPRIFDKTKDTSIVRRTYSLITQYFAFDPILRGKLKYNLISLLLHHNFYKEAYDYTVGSKDPINEIEKVWIQLSFDSNDLDIIKQSIVVLEKIVAEHKSWLDIDDIKDMCIDFIAETVNYLQFSSLYSKFTQEYDNYIANAKEVISTKPDILVVRNIVCVFRDLLDSFGKPDDIEIDEKAMLMYGRINEFANRYTADEIHSIEEYVQTLKQKEAELFINETSDFVKKYLEKEGYRKQIDKVEARKYLEEELNTSVCNKFALSNKAMSVLQTAEYVWQNNLDAQNGDDLIYVVCCYIKSVEIYTFEKVRGLCPNITIAVSINGKGKQDVLVKSDEFRDYATLGNCFTIISRNRNLFFRNSNIAGMIIEDMFNWLRDERNSHFHRDIVADSNTAFRIRHKTLKLIKDMINNMK